MSMRNHLIYLFQEVLFTQTFYSPRLLLKKNVNKYFFCYFKHYIYSKVNEKKIKEPVALSCKWFTINKNNEIIEISGVTGAFYQPCADDIGMKYEINKTFNKNSKF